MKTTEQQRVGNHRSRARKVGSPATLTLAEWEQTIQDFNGNCAYCINRPFTVLEHFLPIEMSGTHVQNCVPACASCNMKKKGHSRESLARIFGRDVIEHIEYYLSMRAPSTSVTRSYKPQGTKTKSFWGIPKKLDHPQTMPMQFLTTGEFAQHLQVTRNTVYHYVRKLSLQKYHKPGDRKTYLAQADLTRMRRAMEDAAQSGGYVLVEGVA